MFLREYYRTALNLALLAVIPLLLVLAVGDSMSRLAEVLEQSLTQAMGQSMSAVWAAAFLTGLTGFFMMVGARAADRRLVRAGYHPAEVAALRFGAVAIVGALATVVSYGVLLTRLTPIDHVQTLLVMYVGALIYGALGILIGSLIPGQLEGSFALLFFFVQDAFVGSPLFGAKSGVFVLLPTHYPTKIVLGLAAGQPHEGVHWLYATLYLAVVALLAGLAFYRVARVR